MIGIGIIGTGRMGNTHAANLSQNPKARLVSAYDINPDHLSAFVQKYPSVSAASSIAEVAENPDVGLIAITSPTYCHTEAIKIAMSTGKPIFCEKPLCRTREELDELTPLITNYSNVFAIGFVRRYSNGGAKLLELVRDGKIGTPISCTVNSTGGGFKREWGDWFADYAKCGGATLDMLAHHVDLTNGMFGAPESVYARALMLSPEREKPCDYVSATTVFKNGVICNLVCSWMRSGPGDNYTIVQGDKGTLKKSDSQGLQFYAPGQPPENIPLDDVRIGDMQEKPEGNMYAVEMASVLDAIENHHAPVAGARQAIDAMKVCLAMLESSESKKVVYFS